jgi:hypothetical protein
LNSIGWYLAGFEGSEMIANAAFQALVDRYRGRPLAEYALAPPEIKFSWAAVISKFL